MTDNLAADLFSMVSGRRGHFRLESGHHSQLWFDLDPLFADPRRIDPLVESLTATIRPYGVDAVCGPLLGGAFLAQLIARALAVEFAFTERVAPSQRDGFYRVEYRLPAALGERLRGKRVAIVDDVMSAGSALRGTFAALQTYEAIPVVAGALLLLGSAGADFFAAHGVPVEAVGRESYTLWLPTDCPLCQASVPVEDVAIPAVR